MKKKITKIILAVCLVVAGLPLFAIGARANDDANTNSEMMISVDNYFDYRNAKLMTASFGAGYTADSMDYPALVCNDVEAPAMAMEAKTNTDLRTSGMMDYFESCKLHLLSWEAFTGEPQDITTMENGLVSCKVYEWVEYTWYSDDFPDPLRPVNTTSLSLGMSTSTFFRLCSFAPLILIYCLESFSCDM